jgi:hypothetical protein
MLQTGKVITSVHNGSYGAAVIAFPQEKAPFPFFTSTFFVKRRGTYVGTEHATKIQRRYLLYYGE